MIGRIYKIIHSQSNICYVGMTTNTLTQRWSSHKCDYNKNNNSKAVIYKYMIKYGIEQFKIVLIKEYDVIDKAHLKVYETLWMKKLKSINENQSFNPFAKSSQAMRDYYKKNSDKVKNKVKEYANANKDLIKERGKEYRSKNKETIKAKKSEKINCECGGIWSKGHGFKRHESSKLHQNWLKN